MLHIDLLKYQYKIITEFVLGVVICNFWFSLVILSRTIIADFFLLENLHHSSCIELLLVLVVHTFVVFMLFLDLPHWVDGLYKGFVVRYHSKVIVPCKKIFSQF